ncbi:MAG: PhoU domain-containing protein [Acidobacteriota bacterium]
MLKELLSIFKGDSPLKETSVDFTRMLQIAREMVLEANIIYWDKKGDQPEQREALYRRDLEVNKLERAIRRRIATHLAVHAPRDVPYCLMMMSLVKDVERVGDYAKNLVDIADLVSEPLPDHPLIQELMEIRTVVEGFADNAEQVFVTSDSARAANLIREGRNISRRCDDLVIKTASSEFSAAVAVKVGVGARFYKRIEAHVLNILSSVIMPLHKLDYFDEDLLPGMESDYAED